MAVLTGIKNWWVLLEAPIMALVQNNWREISAQLQHLCLAKNLSHTSVCSKLWWIARGVGDIQIFFAILISKHLKGCSGLSMCNHPSVWNHNFSKGLKAVWLCMLPWYLMREWQISYWLSVNMVISWIWTIIWLSIDEWNMKINYYQWITIYHAMNR